MSNQASDTSRYISARNLEVFAHGPRSVSEEDVDQIIDDLSSDSEPSRSSPVDVTDTQSPFANIPTPIANVNPLDPAPINRPPAYTDPTTTSPASPLLFSQTTGHPGPSHWASALTSAPIPTSPSHHPASRDPYQPNAPPPSVSQPASTHITPSSWVSAPVSATTGAPHSLQVAFHTANDDAALSTSLHARIPQNSGPSSTPSPINNLYPENHRPPYTQSIASEEGPSLQELVSHRDILREKLLLEINPSAPDSQTFVVMAAVQEETTLGPPTLLFHKGTPPTSLDEVFLLLIAHPQFHLLSDRMLHYYCEYPHYTALIRAGDCMPYSPSTAMATGYSEVDRLPSAVDRVLLGKSQRWVPPLMPIQSPQVRETTWYTFGIQVHLPLFILYIYKEPCLIPAHATQSNPPPSISTSTAPVAADTSIPSRTIGHNPLAKAFLDARFPEMASFLREVHAIPRRFQDHYTCHLECECAGIVCTNLGINLPSNTGPLSHTEVTFEGQRITITTRDIRHFATYYTFEPSSFDNRRSGLSRLRKLYYNLLDPFYFPQKPVEGDPRLDEFIRLCTELFQLSGLAVLRVEMSREAITVASSSSVKSVRFVPKSQMESLLRHVAAIPAISSVLATRAGR